MTILAFQSAIVFLLILLNGLFAMSETALVSARKASPTRAPMEARPIAAALPIPPVPAVINTVLPLSGLASNARHASAIRFASSGVAQRDHSARCALPNIAPPSSFCEFPRIDQSFMRGF